MKSQIMKSQNKLAGYLAISAGAGITSSSAAVVAYSFAPNTVSSSTDSVNVPAGINIGRTSQSGKFYGYVDVNFSTNSTFARSNNAVGTMFTNGADLAAQSSDSRGNYSYSYNGNTFGRRGAIIDGNTKNYANISFNGADNIYEAVGEFVFNGTGGGYLSGLAIEDTGAALSISAGKTAIEAVPEASSLALLALGSAGLLARRNRKIAA